MPFQDMLQRHPQPTWLLSAQGQVVWSNDAAQHVLPLPVGMSITDLLAPSHQAQWGTALQQALIEGATGVMSLTFHTGSGAVVLQAQCTGIAGPDGMLQQVLLSITDTRAYQQAMHDKTRADQRFRDFAASSSDWLWEVDTAGMFTYISPGVQGVLGFQPYQLMGHLWLATLFGEAEEIARESLEQAWQNRKSFQEVEVWTRDHADTRVCIRLSGNPVFQEGVFAGYRGVGANVTGTKLDREQTYRLATTDHLTGLLNWVRFKEELARGAKLSKRHGTQGALVLIDLDRFKEINDTHGHEAGDKILVAVSDILRENVRSTDVAARRGGDEFALLLHNVSKEEAQQKITSILEKVNTLRVQHLGVPLMVTLSAGLVPFPHGDEDPERLIMSADLAMYRAKDLGRNRLYADTADSVTLGTGTIAAQLKGLERLKECLATDDFAMHYQAIIPARPRQRPLFEALLRISDADGKPLPPPLFIEAAEHFGLIQQLDLAVVKKVFQAQQQLNQQGLFADVSINLSSRSLGDAQVTAQLQKLIAEYPINPNHIIFEVTETMALHDPAQMRDIATIRQFISQLRGMGFRFALDDFGTGFTSFRYLKVLPVDLVKIDGEYIKDLLTDQEDRLFVKSMAELCQGLGIQTIAEFVENEAIMTQLIELGIDYGQGWHFAKPLPHLHQLVPQQQSKTMTDFATAPALVAKMLQPVQSTPGQRPADVLNATRQANLNQAPIKVATDDPPTHPTVC